MRRESSFAPDLESLKIAARRARQDPSQAQFSNKSENRTDIVHAGYRLLQCAAAGAIFVVYISFDAAQKLQDMEETMFLVIYPACFIASLLLAIIRLMNFLPNPKPIIPVAISVAGWVAMLTGAILAMRHAYMKLDLTTLSDDEIANDPIFLHNLVLCAMSLVGSSLYLVHAWLCYDCWWWAKKEKKLKEAEASRASTSTEHSDSDSGMPSDDETEPGTSRDQRRKRSSERSSTRSKKLEGASEVRPDENDPIRTLNETLHASVEAKHVEVEDEPVRLYCCCVEIGSVIKREFGRNVPAHEFQVVHVM